MCASASQKRSQSSIVGSSCSLRNFTVSLNCMLDILSKAVVREGQLRLRMSWRR